MSNSSESSPLSPRFHYALGVGFAGVAAVFGVAEYVSVKYLSLYQKMGIAFFFLVAIFGVSGLLLSVLTTGVSLARSLRDYRNVLEFLSEELYDSGMTIFALGLSFYLPALGMIIVIPLFAEAVDTQRLLLCVCASLWSAVLYYRFFISHKGKKRISLRISYITFISVFVLSLLGFRILMEIPYEVTVQEKCYYQGDTPICTIILRPTGFASTDEAEGLNVWLCSGKGEKRKINLEKIENDIYFASFAISDGEVYYIEFEFPTFPWGSSRKREVIMVGTMED
jgi:hypothetical protein